MQSSKKISEEQDKSTLLESDWISAAREMLIEGGVAAVQIQPLAVRLNVTRGGFYWRFQNRQDLLDRLLLDWQNTNVRSLLRAVRKRSGTPQERYRRLVRLWLDEKDFDPALDAAVRQWGNTDREVGELVHKIDAERVEAIADIFVDDGQERDLSIIRARIIYFHQVGYYALGMSETRAEREALMPLYSQILGGL
jgi:AcrR family transcriptional regulator